MKRTLFFVLVLLGSSLLANDSVEDLAWMTGSWIGKMGPNTIEEIWSNPKSGSMQATVRISSETSTLVHEVVVISEDGDSLVLHLQQWSAKFEPLAPATKMTLMERTENSITFAGDSEAMIQRLTYTRVSDVEFTISVTTRNQPEFIMSLSPNGL